MDARVHVCLGDNEGALCGGGIGAERPSVATWRPPKDAVLCDNMYVYVDIYINTQHGILRGSPRGDARAFGADDDDDAAAAKRALVVPKAHVDPRIHFALNCGAR